MYEKLGANSNESQSDQLNAVEDEGIAQYHTTFDHQTQRIQNISVKKRRPSSKIDSDHLNDSNESTYISNIFVTLSFFHLYSWEVDIYRFYGQILLLVPGLDKVFIFSCILAPKKTLDDFNVILQAVKGVLVHNEALRACARIYEVDRCKLQRHVNKLKASYDDISTIPDDVLLNILKAQAQHTPSNMVYFSI